MEGVDVPCHFLCPISLQLMKDPVTISTGITYDRESIEEWLFSCRNKTCPVTKQVLHDEDPTPNHTLRRLIQSWCTLNASRGVEPIPTPKAPIDKTQIAKLISDAKRFPHLRMKCLSRLRSISLESDRNRSCLEAAGAVDFLASIIKNSNDSISSPEVEAFDDGTSSTDLTRLSDEALSTLYHLKISESQNKALISKDGGFVESLIEVLKHGNYQSRAYSIMLLKSLYEVADPIQLVSVGREFFFEIVSVLHDQVSRQATKAALKLLVEICPWGRNRVKAVECGAVFVLIQILLETSEKTECELTLTVLDLLCRCADGRAELLQHEAGLAIVSKSILRVSDVASDRAVKILCSVCKYSASNRVLQEMLQVGAVAKLCLVLLVDSRLRSKERARDILRLHTRAWSNSPCIPLHLMSSYPSS
ncbi:hypothetical protein K2173_020946 [Erythroxylum novogranatense]|uniref:U-box domain-containing protein n=1 Tax=Erythroxylum novogranatense TaxID=1862640 RepID=A0AAV8TM87_9ROSI|nr:hypothetical protein K2173_020946 [Erythroxylum novogranatense]